MNVKSTSSRKTRTGVMLKTWVSGGLFFIGLIWLGSFFPNAMADDRDDLFPQSPQLRLNPDMHTAKIKSVDIDKRECFAVTASEDKSVIVWNLNSGVMLKRLRLPSALGNLGKAVAIALSPDGEQIAVGGHTGLQKTFIYIYQRRSGIILNVIPGLENVTIHLAYSPDGRFLAATLAATGIRIYDTDAYREMFEDKDYGNYSCGASWQGSTGLVTSALDGKIRFYHLNSDCWELKRSIDIGNQPYGLSVHPDGSRVAVGFLNNCNLWLLHLPDLKILKTLPTDGFKNGSLSSLSWSQRGDRLWAGGRYHYDYFSPILCFREDSQKPVSYPVTTNTVMGLRPLVSGDILVASGNGLTRLSDQGKIQWQHLQPLADFREQLGEHSLRISRDGGRLTFGFKAFGNEPAWWDFSQLTLFTNKDNPPVWNLDLKGSSTENSMIKVCDWKNKNSPSLKGQKLNINEFETCRSLAFFSEHQEFVIGTAWFLRCFKATGEQVWQQSVPGEAYTACISGDSRFVVAGLGDGTLRWYDAQTGEERVALFAHANKKDWVAWTPEGFFASSSPSANRLFGYQLNNGFHKAPDFIGAEQLYTSFYRPDLVIAKFEGNNTPIQQALAEIGDVRDVLKSKPPILALDASVKSEIPGTKLTLPLIITDQGGGIGDMVVRVNGIPQNAKAGTRKRQSGIRDLEIVIPPGASSTVDITVTDAKGKVSSDVLTHTVRSTAKLSIQKPNLKGLAIGIEHYKESGFTLKYAIDDAKALKKTLEKQGKGLYRQVDIALLPDATYDDIIKAFKTAQDTVGEDDVFVLYLSGHGVTDNGNYHFLTKNFVWTSPKALETDTIDSKQLNAFLAGIKARKAVVFLDTCYAGSYKPDITATLALTLACKSGPDDKQAVSRMMVEEKTVVDRLNQLSGRAIFYASTNKDVALEGYNKHGLYTALLLEGLKGKASQGDPYVSLHELSSYLETQMPDTSEKQFKIRLYPMAHVPTSFDFTSY